VVEQPIDELKSAGWANLPSGRFMANDAWPALAVMCTTCYALGALAGMGPGRRRDPAHATVLHPRPAGAHAARRLHLRLPTNWPWAGPFLTALTGINALPMRS
jgi:hypothetical protein